MIILPDKNIPRAKFLMPVLNKEWREPSQAVPRDQLGNPVRQTRFRIRAKTHDGVVLWTGWFDDRADFDAFLWSVALGTINQDKTLWDLPSPGYPGLDPILVYDFASLNFVTSSGTWNRPPDWNNNSNTVEALGAGGNGSRGASPGAAGGGGGGGAYAKITNFNAASSETVQIGINGGTTGSGTTPTTNSYLKNSTTLVAAGGATAVSQPNSIGQLGGSTTNCYPTSGAFAGGKGGDQGGLDNNAGGGGGAAGKNGAGNPGGNGSSYGAGGAPGGSGDAGFGGIAGTAGGGTGGNGSEWDATHGSGGGGGGGLYNTAGGNGGLYGAAGGGSGMGINGATGKNGIIVFTYTPIPKTILNMPMLGM